MPTETKTMVDAPVRLVPSPREGRESETATRPSFPQQQEGRPCVTTPAGTTLPCQRHNGDWYNFLLPAETDHVLLGFPAGQDEGSIAELTFFVGAREHALPLPAARAGAHPPGEGTEKVNLPAIPRWIQGLLCIRMNRGARQYVPAEHAA